MFFSYWIKTCKEICHHWFTEETTEDTTHDKEHRLCKKKKKKGFVKLTEQRTAMLGEVGDNRISRATLQYSKHHFNTTFQSIRRKYGPLQEKKIVRNQQIWSRSNFFPRILDINHRLAATRGALTQEKLLNLGNDSDISLRGFHGPRTTARLPAQ